MTTPLIHHYIDIVEPHNLRFRLAVTMPVSMIKSDYVPTQSFPLAKAMATMAVLNSLPSTRH